MDTYNIKWTRLQSEIIRFLCIRAGTSVNKNAMAEALKVSPTSVSQAVKLLDKERLVLYSKSPRMNLTSVELNRERSEAVELKRVQNLQLIYESGLVKYLNDTFPGGIIVLFGSYSYGTDTVNSDIDIAVIGSKAKKLDLTTFNKKLERTVIVQFYDSLSLINKNLRNSLINGIVLKGVIEL